MESAWTTMGFEVSKDGENVNPYLQAYKRLKQSGKIKATSTEQYKCSKCKDTGWITVIATDGAFYKKPCKCLAQMKIEARLKKSGILPEDYARFSLSTFDTDTEEHVDMKRLAIKYLQSRKPSQGIVYTGNSGTGKTHICIAICQELTRKYGQEHYYFNYCSEMQKMKALVFDDVQYSQMIQRWASVDNLYIDDLFKLAKGRDGNIQQSDLRIMFEIINARYLNRKATIFSTEMTIREITDIDEALGSRIKSIVGDYGMACHGANMRLVKGA